MESFLTLQGEGRYTGYNAFFIRLSGCNVGCVWCDVKESWEVSPEQWVPYSEVAKMLTTYKGEIVVVTGGEPCTYNLEALTATIKKAGKRTHIETSGAYEITGEWDWITFSPKKFKQPQESVYQQCHELKVVIFHPSDLEWAETHAKKITNPSVQLLLQVEWSKREKLTPLILEYINNNPKWSLSMQTHKYIGIE